MINQRLPAVWKGGLYRRHGSLGPSQNPEISLRLCRIPVGSLQRSNSLTRAQGCVACAERAARRPQDVVSASCDEPCGSLAAIWPSAGTRELGPGQNASVSEILTLVSPLMRMGGCAAALYAGGRRAGEAARWSDRDRARRRRAAARRCGGRRGSAEAGATGAGAMIGRPAEYGHAAGLRRAGAVGAGDAWGAIRTVDTCSCSAASAG